MKTRIFNINDYNPPERGYNRIMEERTLETIKNVFRQGGKRFGLTVELALQTWGNRYPMEAFTIANMHKCKLEYNPDKNIIEFIMIDEY